METKVETGNYRNRFSIARASLSSSASWRRFSIQGAPLMPCFMAFCEAVAFPFSLTGPVDRSHGFQRLIFAACSARCSGVQRRGMLGLPFVG